MKRTVLMTVIAGLIVAGASYLIPRGDPTKQDPAPIDAVGGGRSVDRLSEVERLIEVFESRVLASGDALDMWTLGAHYLDRATITGAVADYQKARSVLDRAYETNAGNPNVDLPLATARLGLHDFTGARELADPFVQSDPGNTTALVISGDAALAYGDIEAAEGAYDRLNRMAPDDPAVAVRQASLDWQVGMRTAAIEGARRALRLAVDQPSGTRAFYTTYVGLLQLETGDYDAAKMTLEEALELDPSYVPAMIELGHVRAAGGDNSGAISILEESLLAGPEPEVAALLGDLYSLEGDTEAAERHYRQVEEIANVAPEAYRRDVSRFLSDHERDLKRALRLAEDDLGARRDSGAYDTLAWALYRNGRLDEARVESDRALALGTSDAAAFHHSGLISLAQGDLERARENLAQALEMNPHFHPLLAVEARDLLTRLDGAG